MGVLSDGGPDEVLDRLITQLPVGCRVLAFEAVIRLENQSTRHETAAKVLRHIPQIEHEVALISSLAFIKNGADHLRWLSAMCEFFSASVVCIVIRHAQMVLDDHAFAQAIGRLLTSR